MGASAEKCPQCGERVGRFDYQCPSCELILEDREAPPREKREVSVVRAMMERPRSRTEPGRPKKPERPESVSTTGPVPALPSLDRVLHVKAQLRLEQLNLHPYDAWLVSLIDGASTGQMLATKLALAPRELQGVLQGLIEQGVISLGAMKASAPAPRPSERAKTVSMPDAAQPAEPTEVLNRDALAAQVTSPHLRTPPPPPPPPPKAEGRRLTGPAQKPLAQKSGSRPALVDGDEDEESTVGMGKGGGPAVRRGPEPDTLEEPRPEPTVMLPRPDEIVAPVETETELAEPTLIKKPAPAPQPRPRPQEPQLSSRPTSKGGAQQARPVSHGAQQARPPSQPAPMRPMSDPYRPPQPASASRIVPKPTLGIDDVDAQGALQVALQMEQSGRLEEAVSYLERAISRSPDAAPLYNRLAVILMRDFDDLTQAEQLAVRALELSPGHPVFARNLNTIRQKLRQQKGTRR